MAEPRVFLDDTQRRHLDRVRCPITVACGDVESLEFQRQAMDFARALHATAYPAELIRIAGANHFEVLDRLARPDGELARAALAQMR